MQSYYLSPQRHRAHRDFLRQELLDFGFWIADFGVESILNLGHRLVGYDAWKLGSWEAGSSASFRLFYILRFYSSRNFEISSLQAFQLSRLLAFRLFIIIAP